MHQTGDKPFQCDVCSVRFSRSGNLRRHQITHTGDKPFECDVCNKRFTQSNSLVTHKRCIHNLVKPYKSGDEICLSNGTQRPTEKIYSQHAKSNTVDNPYQCDVCTKKFSRSQIVAKRKRRVHQLTTPCDSSVGALCQSKDIETGTKDKEAYSQHLQSNTGDKPYECDVCSVRFARSGNMKRHKRIHTGDKPYECDVCNTRFTQSSSLVTHKRRIHNLVKPYKSSMSSKVCHSNDAQIHPANSNNGDTSYQCNVCSEKLSGSNSLKRHKKTHTGDKPYECVVCNKKFSRSSTLAKHKRFAHQSSTPYEHDGCNLKYTKGFCDSSAGETCQSLDTQGGTTRKETLQHVQVTSNTGDKPYECDVCNNRSTGAVCDSCGDETCQSNDIQGDIKRKETYSQPAKLSSVERPYECDVCSLRFSRSGNMKRHKITHTGDKPYECDVCNKRFTQSSSLVTHKRCIHNIFSEMCQSSHIQGIAKTKEPYSQHEQSTTVEKPYQCDVCSRRFTRSNILKQHKRTHKPYECEVCNKRYTRSRILAKHKSRVHQLATPYEHDICKRDYPKGFCDSSCGEVCQSNNIQGQGSTKSKKTYLQHVQSNIEDKSYQCDTCFVRFSRSSNMKRHKRIHTGDKPYECDVCYKRFTQSSSLVTHKRCIHELVKPYNSNICSKEFPEAFCDSPDVEVTMSNIYFQDIQGYVEKVSPGEDYDCDVNDCEEQFPDFESLIEGQTKDPDTSLPYGFTEEPSESTSIGYVCSLCGMAFDASQELENHMHKHNTGDI